MATLKQLQAQIKRLKGVKKKTSKKKKTTKTKSAGGLKAYQRKINNAPGVKSAAKRVKSLEMSLKKAKAEKARKVKAAQKKYKSKTK